MTGDRIDLGEILADYAGDTPAPRRPPRIGPPLQFDAADDDHDEPLGPFMTNLKIGGVKGDPTPKWTTLDQPAPRGALSGLVDTPPGSPPPTLNFDARGMYYNDPATGDRVDVEFRCQGCGAENPSTLTKRGPDPRWLCDRCADDPPPFNPDNPPPWQ